MSVSPSHVDRFPRPRARRQDRDRPSRAEHQHHLRQPARSRCRRWPSSSPPPASAAAIASATSLPNGLPVIVSFLAAAMAGTAAPLNPAYKEDEFRFYLEDTAAKVLLLPPDGADDARRAAVERGVPILTIDMDAAGTVSLTGASASRSRASRSRRPSVDDVALVLHTSGSTGPAQARAARRTRTCRSPRRTSRAATRSTPDDVSLCVMPLFHVHGLVASTLATLASGGTVVVPAKFSPLSFWRTARDHGVTWYSAVPTLHQLLLARAAIRDPSRRPAGTEKLRFIRSCSASLPPAGDARARGGVRRAGARGVRHDGGGAPDGVQPAAAAGAQAGIGRARHRRADQHHGRGRQPPAGRRARRGRDQGPERDHAATRTTPRRTPRRSSTAGSAPAIRASSTRTAT